MKHRMNSSFLAAKAAETFARAAMPSGSLSNNKDEYKAREIAKPSHIKGFVQRAPPDSVPLD
jgi:hypothetical protein